MLAPILVKLGVIDPQTFHTEPGRQVSARSPPAAFGGISLDHPLGVEPGTGRDILARLLYGVTLSLFDRRSRRRSSASSIGIVARHHRRLLGRLGRRRLGRLMDLILSFPQILMLLALSPVLIDRMHRVCTCRRRATPRPWSYLILVLGLFGWPVPRPHHPRPGALACASASSSRRPSPSGAKHAADLLQGDPAQPVGADPRLHHADPADRTSSAEAALRFLGVGHQAADADPGHDAHRLGELRCSRTRRSSSSRACSSFIVVLAFNLLGDGLRDALDPKAGRIAA